MITLLALACVLLQSSARPLRDIEVSGETADFYAPVRLEFHHKLNGPHNQVFVLGDVPELGGGDLRFALRMAGVGDDWTVRVRLPIDRDVHYRFYERDARSFRLRDVENGLAISEERVLRARRDPVFGKQLIVHTDFEDPILFWRQGRDEPFEEALLSEIGAGRVEGEQRLGAFDFAPVHRPLEFYLRERSGERRDPDVGTYRTPLDRAFLQDGELFTYVPAPIVSPARRDYAPLRAPVTFSTILGYEKQYFVFLPRGYGEHLDRRYGVLYHYDGQFVFDYGQVGYDEDSAKMTALVAAGECSELIQVAVASGPGNQLRLRETIPPEDPGAFSTGTGHADLFLRFITEELKALIDAGYRTLPDRENTFLRGFSQGGLLALYAGWEFYDSFSAVACQSAALAGAPNFSSRILLEDKRPLRLYMDFGDLEWSIFPVAQGGRLFDDLVTDRPPWVYFDDLRFHIAFFTGHGDPGGRIRQISSFLAPALRERDPDLWGGR